MRLSLLYSERAGDGVSRHQLREALEKQGHELVHMIEHDADLGRVTDGSSELLVAAGGDGTVRRAAIAIAGRGIALAILPMGTANNIAESFGITGAIPELIESWNEAHRAPLDVGIVRGIPGESRFLESVGIGLVPAAISAVHAESGASDRSADSRLARAVRKYDQVLSRLQPRRCMVSLDGAGREEELLLLEALNIRSVGPNLVLSPDANPSDGLLSIVAAGRDHRDELAHYLRCRMRGEDGRISLPARLARQIEIRGWDEMHVDGKVRQAPSISVTIAIEVAAVPLLA